MLGQNTDHGTHAACEVAVAPEGRLRGLGEPSVPLRVRAFGDRDDDKDTKAMVALCECGVAVAWIDVGRQLDETTKPSRHGGQVSLPQKCLAGAADDTLKADARGFRKQRRWQIVNRDIDVFIVPSVNHGSAID